MVGVDEGRVGVGVEIDDDVEGGGATFPVCLQIFRAALDANLAKLDVRRRLTA
jgi:hypothetical protein